MTVKKFVTDESLTWEERYHQLEAHHGEETEALAARVERNRLQWDAVAAALHGLPDAVLGPVAEKCRNLPGRCFCGCHRGTRFDDFGGKESLDKGDVKR